MKLFHATGSDALENIARIGLFPRNHWTSSHPVVLYYAETVEDEDRTSCILTVDLEGLKTLCDEAQTPLLPDRAGIEEPITSALGKKENQVWQEWRDSDKTWQDSLNIVGSLLCPVAIPPELLRVVVDLASGQEVPLLEHMGVKNPSSKKGPQ
jgi:hypothetical protein